MSVYYLYGVATGQIGISPNDFWDMTAKEFFYCQKSYLDHLELQRVQSWSQVRWQTAVLVNLKLKKQDQIDPQDLFEFDFEKKEVVEVSIEIQNNLMAQWEAQEKAKYNTPK